MSRASIVFAALALAACSGSGERAPPAPASAPSAAAPSGPSASLFEPDAPAMAEVGNLCHFRPRKDPVMMGHRDRTGAQWEGEIRIRDLAMLDPKFPGPQDKRIATVVARPRGEIFRVRVDDNCYDPARRAYYACTKVLEADLTKIRGFARAPQVGQARALAIQLCEKKVAEVVESQLELRQDNVELRCRVVEQAFCELPPAPPPPATAKKK